MQTQQNPALFATENVRDFAEAWYRALDVHAPAEECLRLLAEEGLEMIFPEKTLRGRGDFLAWYAGGSYGDGSSAPGVINIFFDEVHTVQSVTLSEMGRDDGDAGATVEVVVGWQASWFEPPAAKSKRTSMNATQRWQVRPCSTDKNPYGLEITSYDAVAKPFDYTPGFARL